MFTAVLVACLVAEPETCRTHEILLSSPMPVMQFMEAQTKAVEWLQKHPDLVMRDLRVVRGRGV